MLRYPLACGLTVLLGVAAMAQEMRFYYPAPAAGTVEVSADVPYGALRMDVYRPKGASGQLPALVFFNIATGAQRSNTFYKAWAETAASRQLVAICPTSATTASRRISTR
jgi:hypothetical protein